MSVLLELLLLTSSIGLSIAVSRLAVDRMLRFARMRRLPAPPASSDRHVR
jgi:hypothetical protein